MTHSTIITSSGKHIGKVRKSNQDNVVDFNADESPIPGVPVLAVADGMGGHAGGETASKLALQTVKDAFSQQNFPYKTSSVDDLKKIIKDAFIVSNEVVKKTGNEDPNLNGMGTTLTIAAIYKDTVIFGNIGDSRGYLINRDQIKQITKDHSWVAEQLAAGHITQKEADNHPQRNIITKAIGLSGSVVPDIFEEKVSEGDCILLCTDGLYPLVSDQEIMNSIEASNLKNTCNSLISLANNHGGNDNIAVAIANIKKLNASKIKKGNSKQPKTLKPKNQRNQRTRRKGNWLTKFFDRLKAVVKRHK